MYMLEALGESPGFWRARAKSVRPPSSGVAGACATLASTKRLSPLGVAEEEANFGLENPSLEERAFLGAEIEAAGVEESGIDGEECSQDGEEARVPKIRRAPRGPTQLEREQHEALHLPYRDWRGRCVRGA